MIAAGATGRSLIEPTLQAQRRRTFAIISHPDAGKTTLTEKFLLYGGALDRGRRRGQGPRGSALGHVGLDGAREAARDLDHLDCAAVPLPELRGEPARHPGPPRLLRGHLPRAGCGGCGGDGARRGEGHRTADAEAVRGVPGARPAAAHVHQQVGPARSGTARAARPDRGSDRRHADAGHLAGRHRRRLPWGSRPPDRRRSSASPGSPVAHRRARGGGHGRAGRRPTRALAWSVAVDELALLAGVSADHDPELFLEGESSPTFFGSAVDELRRAAPARRADRSGPAARAPRGRGGQAEAARRAVLGLRVQGPGQHGPFPPRPHRLSAGLLRSVRARDGGDPRADAAGRSPPSTRIRSSARSARRSRRRFPATSWVW